MSLQTSLLLSIGLGFSLTLTSFSQNRFPEFIPDSGIVLELETVAALPDSSGSPPRVSVVTRSPDGRLFANDQRGVLYYIPENGNDPVVYLDLGDYPANPVVSTFEAGFQSFAFHPDFYREGSAGFGRFYTIHSTSNTSVLPDFDPGGSTAFHTVILEWRTNEPDESTFIAAETANPNREIMRLKQPFGNHNGGLISFNPTVSDGDVDFGNLYIAIADGGSGGDPQENGEDPSNPYGAILRIDPLGTDSDNGHYGWVTANVMASDDDSETIPEIYAYGFRNPQRFSWDLVTQNLFVADIGQNAVEEINLVENGKNYGWDTREGSFSVEGTASNLVDPVAEYDHTNPVSSMPTSIGNRAVTVGEVARGVCLPELDGILLLGDFPTGLIFGLNVDTDPLDGGQDGLKEIRLRTENGEPQSFLQIINEERSKRQLPAVSRTDLRFSVNTPGEIFLSNKQDGIIRKVKTTIEPSIKIKVGSDSKLEVIFSGILEESDTLENWWRIPVQPRSPWTLSDPDSKFFLRAKRP